MTLVQRLFVALSGVLLVACASSSAASDARAAMLVTLHDFKTGERFELASESHTERVTYYSDARRDAARKVQTDEIMSAFVGELERQGLGAHAQPGRAPAVASGGAISWGLELENDAQRTHWLVGKGSPAEDWQEFQRCRDIFLQLYNITVSFQAVQNDSGRGFFEEQTQAAGGKRK